MTFCFPQFRHCILVYYCVEFGYFALQTFIFDLKKVKNKLGEGKGNMLAHFVESEDLSEIF